MKNHRTMKTPLAVAVALCAAGCGGPKASDYPPSSTASQSSSMATAATPTAETHPVPRTDTLSRGDTSPSASSAGPTTIDPATPAPMVSSTETMVTPPSTGGGPQPDNSRVNARDRGGAALTPMDQGGSKSDREITQNIRKAVVADKSLSFTAKNVKIITVNGKVTLRGPVKTDNEKANIEAAARKVAPEVDSQIEVKK